MKKEFNFYDLDVWRKGNELVVEIYKVTKVFPRQEIFGITSQLRRAACSITANIAEGFERYYFKDKIRFYYQARSSAAETQNFLLLSNKLNYISQETCLDLVQRAEDLMCLINGLIRSISSRIK